MGKRTLLSFLAIPFFSIASTFNSFSQKVEDVSAGVIDFLLANPKTADNLKPSEEVALGIISDLLKIQGQRKHEIEYAIAGKDQITINTTDGRQAQFVKNENGDVFLIVDGTIHPISPGLVNKALSVNHIGINSATLPAYDMEVLKKEYFPAKIYKYWEYQSKKGETWNDVLKKIPEDRTEISDFGYWSPVYKNPGNLKEKLLYDNFVQTPEIGKKWISFDVKPGKKAPRNLKYRTLEFSTQIGSIFTCKWYRDFNGDDKISFDEHREIRKYFYDNEDFYIVITGYTGTNISGQIDYEIFNDSSGELFFSKHGAIFDGNMLLMYEKKNAKEFSPGKYLINVKLIDRLSKEILSNKNESFEILQHP